MPDPIGQIYVDTAAAGPPEVMAAARGVSDAQLDALWHAWAAL